MQRLTGQIISLSLFCVNIVMAWPGLAWAGISPMDMITRALSTANFLCIRSFLAWWQTNTRTTNWLILEQSCSWPLRRQSFAIYPGLSALANPSNYGNSVLHPFSPNCWGIANIYCQVVDMVFTALNNLLDAKIAFLILKCFSLNTWLCELEVFRFHPKSNAKYIW